MKKELVKRFLAFGAAVFILFIAYCFVMRMLTPIINNMYIDMAVSILLLIVTLYTMFRLIVWTDKQLDKK